jgi:hypothetical protein
MAFQKLINASVTVPAALAGRVARGVEEFVAASGTAALRDAR